VTETVGELVKRLCPLVERTFQLASRFSPSAKRHRPRNERVSSSSEQPFSKARALFPRIVLLRLETETNPVEPERRARWREAPCGDVRPSRSLDRERRDFL
jgi:hypothetical protein